MLNVNSFFSSWKASEGQLRCYEYAKPLCDIFTPLHGSPSTKHIMHMETAGATLVLQTITINQVLQQPPWSAHLSQRSKNFLLSCLTSSMGIT